MSPASRYFPLATLCLGLAMGLVIGDRHPRKSSASSSLPTVDYTSDIVMFTPPGPSRFYRPHSVHVNGRAAFVSEVSISGTPVTVFYFEEGTVQVACTEVTPHP